MALVSFVAWIGAIPAFAAGAEVTFRLVRLADWPPKGQDTPVLPVGKVRLYRPGSYSPDLEVEANEVVSIPPGKWVWVAESEGYVSVVAGTANIPSGPPDERQAGLRTVYWPVVPACRVSLDSEAAWSGVDRLDVVSITENAVYPVDPARRRDLWVPAGELLAYSVGSRGLLGVEDLGRCTQAQEIEISPPPAPDADRQDLMVTAYLPEGFPEPGRPDLEVQIEAGGATLASSVAQVWVKNRVSSFFLAVPATKDVELVYRHSALRTHRTEVESLGGSARELPEQHLVTRPDLRLEIDYRPLRDHDRAEVEISHCGLEQTRDPRTFASCERLDQRELLQPGLHTYTFEGLDVGLYYLEARIDDFVVPDLGASVHPYIEPGAKEPPPQNRALLYEQEISGSILLGGEAIHGTVGLLSHLEEHRRLPDHRFATGDDGLYHLFYFGRLPGVYDRPPGFEGSSHAEDLLGIYGDYQLTACTADGFCQPFSNHSVLQGAGRMDLEIGNRTKIQVRVTDAETGEPIPDAILGMAAPERALYFHHGEVDWFPPPGSEGSYVRTSQAGVGEILAGSRGDRIALIVHHPGYEVAQASSSVVPNEVNHLDVALEPKGGSTDGTRVVFEDGSPVSAGYVLVASPSTGVDAHCSTGLSSEGYVKLPDRCLFGRTAVVVAPGARISVLDGASFSGSSPVELARAPSRPVRLRLVDDDGSPVAGVPVYLRYPEITLGPGEFLMAATYSGYQPFSLTNGQGELALRGVDPDAATAPDVGVLVGDDLVWEPLSPYRAGETVVLTLPSQR